MARNWIITWRAKLMKWKSLWNTHVSGDWRIVFVLVAKQNPGNLLKQLLFVCMQRKNWIFETTLSYRFNFQKLLNDFQLKRFGIQIDWNTKSTFTLTHSLKNEMKISMINISVLVYSRGGVANKLKRCYFYLLLRFAVHWKWYKYL